MVRVANGEHEGHEDKMHMKSESIEPQNTQKCAEIFNGLREGQEKSFCVFLRCPRLKKNHRIRRNAQKYIMVQERNKKKVSVSFCVVCG